jgi:hypothetical protein
VTTISSPMRALSNSITIMEPSLDSVKTKVYRSVHMGVDGRSQFITLNSSWTLLGPGGKEGLCLDNSRTESEEEENPSGGFFCTFANVSESFTKFGSIEKGCSREDSDKFPSVLPLDCQPILPSNC